MTPNFETDYFAYYLAHPNPLAITHCLHDKKADKWFVVHATGLKIEATISKRGLTALICFRA